MKCIPGDLTGTRVHVVAYMKSCCAGCNGYIGAHCAAQMGHFPIITPEGIVLLRAGVCHPCLADPASARGLATAIVHNIGAWCVRQTLPADDIEKAAGLPDACSRDPKLARA